ncbi:MAG: class I fructose-bisphosphate aldolase [Roseimicrobium sp.]
MSRQDNLDTFFRDGKTVILPIDHGVAIPVPGLENPFQIIEQVNPFVDGYVLNLGLALRTGDMLTGKGICLRTDVYNTRTSGRGAGSINIYGMGEAEMVGATAVMNMLFPGSENEEAITQNCADLISESLDIDIPIILEALPVGLGQPEHYTVAKVGFAVRLAAELGADVVKTAYPIDAKPDDFRRIVESSYVPVIVLGGAAMGNDLDLLSMTSDAMKAGASGIAIGRNVWQHPNPAAVARSLAAIVHEGAKVEEALMLMKEPI